MSTSSISKLRSADDDRRQTKRNSLADKLTVEANTLADLKVEKAKFDGDKKVVEAELARSAIWRRCLAPTTRRSSDGSFSSWHYCWYPAAVLLVHAAATEAMNCSLKAPPCFPTERENTIKICKTTPYQSVPPSQCTPCLPSPSGETSM